MFDLIRQDIDRYNCYQHPFLVGFIRSAYTHPALIGVIWYRIGHALWLRRRNPLYFILFLFQRIFYPLIRIYSGLEISPRTQIGPGLYVAHFGPTIFHPDTIAGSHLTVLQDVTIGGTTEGVPHLGNHVSISTGARVLGAISLGDNVVVGAGAVVVNNVPSGCTVVGIPAKPVSAVGYFESFDDSFN